MEKDDRQQKLVQSPFGRGIDQQGIASNFET